MVNTLRAYANCAQIVAKGVKLNATARARGAGVFTLRRDMTGSSVARIAFASDARLDRVRLGWLGG
jgi:hypothetical protein